MLFEKFIKYRKQRKEDHVNHSPKDTQKRIEQQMWNGTKGCFKPKATYSNSWWGPQGRDYLANCTWNSWTESSQSLGISYICPWSKVARVSASITEARHSQTESSGTVYQHFPPMSSEASSTVRTYIYSQAKTNDEIKIAPKFWGKYALLMCH